MVMMIEAMRDNNLLAGKVYGFDFASEEVHPLEHLAHGIDDGGEVEVARRHLVQHGREQEKVLPVDERHLDIRIASQRFLLLHGGVQTGESTAQNQDAFGLVDTHSSLPVNR